MCMVCMMCIYWLLPMIGSSYPFEGCCSLFLCLFLCCSCSCAVPVPVLFLLPFLLLLLFLLGMLLCGSSAGTAL
ncbi:hypothetical protein BZA05DRAFT_397399 [Tricharina praecox]|uniref:uncharacterized protein n=1 Tax=Tricharina praecox TaxID=43433 RepID=UPI00221FB0DB|nr:uncharacterized protein BZA05DRAFT_397399 [Tricharina praecox]KAI5852278.1 hypothetical protein BZA05DRAFT_397399 [Tricharina praecox]